MIRYCTIFALLLLVTAGKCSLNRQSESQQETSKELPVEHKIADESTNQTESNTASQPISHLKNIHDFESLLAQTDKPVAIKFEASWCGPCKQVAPLFQAVAEEYYDRVSFAIINVDDDFAGPICQRYAIRGVPAIIFLNNGKQVSETLVGRFATKDVLINKLKTIFNI